MQAAEFIWLQTISSLLTVTTDPVTSSPYLFQSGVKQVNLSYFQEHNQTRVFDSALICIRNTVTF